MNMIVAVDRKWGISKQGKLLASLPTDMRWFKQATEGNIIIMGRKTFESLPGGKPLPNRQNIVLTRDKDYRPEGCLVFHSWSELQIYLAYFNLSNKAWLIGGASLYRRYYEECDMIYVTKFEKDLRSDKFIYNIDRDKDYTLIYKTQRIIEKEIPFSILVYARK